MALSFASALDSAFSLSPELDDLSQSVQSKQESVTSQSRELEALEARLRETEERLKRSRASSPAAGAALHQQPRKPLAGQEADVQIPRKAVRAPEEAGSGRQDSGVRASGRPSVTSPGTEDFASDDMAQSPSNGSRPPSRKVYSRGRPEGPTSRGSGR